MVMSDVSSNGFLSPVVNGSNYSLKLPATKLRNNNANGISSGIKQHSEVMNGSSSNSSNTKANAATSSDVDNLDTELSSLMLNDASTAAASVSTSVSNSSTYQYTSNSTMDGANNASSIQSSYSSPQLNEVAPGAVMNGILNGGLSSNSTASSNNQHHQSRPQASTGAIFTKGGSTSGSGSASSAPGSHQLHSSASSLMNHLHSSSSHNLFYPQQQHQHHDALSSQQYNIGANPHNIIHSDYGLKYNGSLNSGGGKSSLLSPKKQHHQLNGTINGLLQSNSHNHSPANNKHQQQHSSYSIQQQQQRLAEMAAVAVVAAASHNTHGMRRSNLHGMNSNSSQHHGSSHDFVPSGSSKTMGGTNNTQSPLQSNSSSTNHQYKQSGLHRLSHKERPALLAHCTTGDTNKDTVLNQFRDVLFMLTWQPDAFDNVVPFLVGALNCSRVKTDTNICLANLLVSWSIAEENFRFTGAKLSNYLCLPEQLNFNFKVHFFKSVRSEVDRMDQLIKQQSNTNHQKLEGVLLFICELYLNMGDVEVDSYGSVIVSRIEFLRNVLKDAMLKILELSPFDKPFLIVGRALKLTGAALDEIDNSDAEMAKYSSKTKTDRIYMHIQAIQQDPNTSQKVRDLYGRVLELRKAKWISDEFRSAEMAVAAAHHNHNQSKNNNHNNHSQNHHNQQQQQQNSHHQHPQHPHSQQHNHSHHQSLNHHLNSQSLPNSLHQHHHQKQHQLNYLNYENHVVNNHGNKKQLETLNSLHHFEGISPECATTSYNHPMSLHRSSGGYNATSGAARHNGTTAPYPHNNSNHQSQQQQNGRSIMNDMHHGGGMNMTVGGCSNNGIVGGVNTTSYSSVAANGTGGHVSMYHQNAATIASVTAEMPQDPVFFLSDGTAIPAHEADFELSCDYDSYIPDFFNPGRDPNGGGIDMSGAGVGGVASAAGGEAPGGAHDCLFMPDNGMLSGYNEALAAYENTTGGVDVMNGGGDILPRVHTLTDEEEAAFSMFLQQSEQQQQSSSQQIPPQLSMNAHNLPPRI